MRCLPEDPVSLCGEERRAGRSQQGSAANQSMDTLASLRSGLWVTGEPVLFTGLCREVKAGFYLVEMSV